MWRLGDARSSYTSIKHSWQNFVVYGQLRGFKNEKATTKLICNHKMTKYPTLLPTLMMPTPKLSPSPIIEFLQNKLVSDLKHLNHEGCQ